MNTIKLTMAQALVRYLSAQRCIFDGRDTPLFAGLFAIFGHGNVAGLGEALYDQRDALPTYRAHNEQAMTHAAIAFANEQERHLKDVAAVLKSTPEDASERVKALLDERKRLERELTDTRRKLATGGAAEGPAAKEIAGVRFVGQRLDGVAPRDLKGMVDDLKKTGSGVYALVAVNDGKASLVVGVSDELCDKLNAVDLVKAGSQAVGGKGGGGRPDMAQAGGPDGDKADQAIAAIESELAAG